VLIADDQGTQCRVGLADRQPEAPAPDRRAYRRDRRNGRHLQKARHAAPCQQYVSCRGLQVPAEGERLPPQAGRDQQRPLRALEVNAGDARAAQPRVELGGERAQQQRIVTNGV
jgi:hypothetical protein